MALPISPTPVLKGRDAKRFLEKVEEDLKKPANFTPTPKLEEAKKIIINHDRENSEQD